MGATIGSSRTIGGRLTAGSFGQEFYDARAERNAVFSLGLHPFGRHGPQSEFEVDFVPDHQADLAGARCGEDQKLEGEFGASVCVRPAYGGQRLRDLVVGSARWCICT